MTSPGGVDDPVRVRSVPAGHPYVAAALDHPRLHLVPDPPVPGAGPGVWWPHPALSIGHVREHAHEWDVVHLHFGAEHLSVEQTRAWVDALADAGVPLVVTVHDLDNPHLREQDHHRALLDVLVPAAAAVLTLTRCAAARIADRWGVRARVLPHPHLAPLARIEEAEGRWRDSEGELLVRVVLKDLRANVEPAIVEAVLAGVRASEVPARLVVDVHPGVLAPDGDRPEVAQLLERVATDPLARVDAHPPWSDEEVHEALGATNVLVLPYTHGTHSGWLELCADLGVLAVVPAHGCYADQHPAVAADGTVPGAFAAAVTRALRDVDAHRRSGAEIAPWQATAVARDEQRREVAAAHAEIHRAIGRTP